MTGGYKQKNETYVNVINGTGRSNRTKYDSIQFYGLGVKYKTLKI